MESTSGIRHAPRIRQVYWCAYPADTVKPEFSKKRPVVVISKKSNRHGVVTVVPVTTAPQDDNRFAVRIVSPFTGRCVWVICNHVTTVAVSRLEAHRSSAPRVRQDDFTRIVEKVLGNLPDKTHPSTA